MKTVAIIPIKLNNERLPGKNTRELGGKPLISYCIDSLLGVKSIDEIYVYCSNESINKYIPKGVNFFKRPEYLDSPETNFTQIFEEFSKQVKSDIYVYAHATAPFVKTHTIEREINAVKNDGYDSAFCAECIQDFLWKDGEPLNFDADNLPQSQKLPIIWRETSGVYVFKSEVFKKTHRRIGKNPCIISVGKKEAVDINTYEDFAFAQQLLDWEE